MQVLLVEDNPMNRRVVRQMLELAEIGLDEAEEGEAGLQLLAQNHYDLVLMDLRMPGMDGLTAIGKNRARGDDKAKIPVIVVTADGAAEIRTRCVNAGANDLVTKPLDMTQLFDAIARVLAASKDFAPVIA
jgi:CheY-like chemotaxis protein